VDATRFKVYKDEETDLIRFGYRLIATGVDLKGRKARLELRQNDTMLRSEVARGRWYVYV